MADIHVAGASQNPYYVLEELAAPSAEYELAKPIYFYVTGENGVYTVHTTETEVNGKPDWSKATASTDTVVTMIDIRITGAKVTLQKVDSESGDVIPDGSAELALYRASDDEKVCSWNGEKLVDGYLEPGMYYIVEAKAPAGYEDTLVGQKMYFIVNSDYTITVGRPSYVESTNPESNEETYFGDAYSNMPITKIEVDVSDIQGDSHAIQFKPTGDAMAMQKDISEGTNTFTGDGIAE